MAKHGASSKRGKGKKSREVESQVCEINRVLLGPRCKANLLSNKADLTSSNNNQGSEQDQSNTQATQEGTGWTEVPRDWKECSGVQDGYSQPHGEQNNFGPGTDKPQTASASAESNSMACQQMAMWMNTDQTNAPFDAVGWVRGNGGGETQ